MYSAKLATHKRQCKTRIKDKSRQPQLTIYIGDKVLIKTHIISKADQGLTAKFTPRRDGPYMVMGKKGSSCYVIADIQKPNVPISTHHISALTLHSDSNVSSKPMYPIRQGGRPANNAENITANRQNENKRHHNENTHTTSPRVEDSNTRRSSRMQKKPVRPDV